MYSTHLAWPRRTGMLTSHNKRDDFEECLKELIFCVHIPLMVRLKQPSLSPERESAPHWRTTALGWYISMTLAMIWQRHQQPASDKKKICVWWSHRRSIKRHLQVWRWLHRTHRQYRLLVGSLLHNIFPFQLRCPAHIGELMNYCLHTCKTR